MLQSDFLGVPGGQFLCSKDADMLLHVDLLVPFSITKSKSENVCEDISKDEKRPT